MVVVMVGVYGVLVLESMIQAGDAVTVLIPEMIGVDQKTVTFSGVTPIWIAGRAVAVVKDGANGKVENPLSTLTYNCFDSYLKKYS
ncbi:hypothetical protein LOAG_16629 [Loa loa]|uniref:Uncharacterized protein n=1 Tax=Loa loa TaxID=7209 RepID=A0A1S0ULN8_LOALO|nr:hypothetical protein LOAG_16629 [Loa loa]EJD76391.1 hypothetical protein LOAG_16629 [Loa loa]